MCVEFEKPKPNSHWTLVTKNMIKLVLGLCYCVSYGHGDLLMFWIDEKERKESENDCDESECLD